MCKEQTSKSVIVVVADQALATIQELANLLKMEGMDVKRVLPLTGIISGICPSPLFDKLQDFEGVETVEEEAVAKHNHTDR